MADVKWIKITTDIFDDEKILLIEALPDADSIIVIWFKLLCLAGKMNNSGVFVLNNQIAYTDKMLSTIFRRKESTVQMALKTFESFGMVEIVDGVITIPNWGKHQNMDKLEKQKAYMRNYMAEYREKQTALAACKVNCKTNSKVNSKTNSKTNVNEADKELDKEIEEENNHCASQPSPAAVNAFFESVWALYPIKRGKGQVSKSKREALYQIGLEELTRAIDRYIMDLQKDESWRKPQNGSTFFNSGYVDYLDANYAGETAPTRTGNRRSEAAAAALQNLFAEEQDEKVEVGDDC
ncbi:phage replisome organizer N-terminal domain-containing protein [Hominenteromicrobium sp.]|uniref:phage replisome organizer N-terminal domain-containing protein n=1 Tax=Hominenteromicrobium sp. TaxID=3073581 RepID=UPI003A942640